MAAGEAAYGTVAWARKRDGRLTAAESVREVAKGILVVLRTGPAQIRERLGFSNSRAFSFDLDTLVVPDSAIAKEAEELCVESSPGFLLNHCHRTYAWGMILGARDGLEPDPELLYVSTMLHDLALTDRFKDYAPMPCFGARAGILATDWAGERGWPEHKCRTLGDVISLHLNTEVPAHLGPEAHLLQAGAGLDVIGLRHWELAPETVAAVVGRHPRLKMKSEGLPAFAAESHSGTRTQLLNRYLAFTTLARHSQFQE